MTAPPNAVALPGASPWSPAPARTSAAPSRCDWRGGRPRRGRASVVARSGPSATAEAIRKSGGEARRGRERHNPIRGREAMIGEAVAPLRRPRHSRQQRRRLRPRASRGPGAGRLGQRLRRELPGTFLCSVAAMRADEGAGPAPSSTSPAPPRIAPFPAPAPTGRARRRWSASRSRWRSNGRAMASASTASAPGPSAPRRATGGRASRGSCARSRASR